MTKVAGIRVLALVLVVAWAAGCASVGAFGDRQDVTPLERAKMQHLLMMERYMAQYRDAEQMGEMAKAGRLSSGQVEVYRKKKQLLEEAYPLITAFDTLIEGGNTPSTASEDEIFKLLNGAAALGK